MPLGRVMGVQVKVHPLFAGVIGIAALGGQGAPVLVLLGLLLTHEMAHFIVARICDLEVSEIEFLPFGGVARVEGLPDSEAGVESAVAVAGPLNNFLLLSAGLWMRDAGWLDPALTPFFIEGNLALALFNLLPVLPLDGGRFLRGLLAFHLGYGRATFLLARCGQMAGAGLAGIGLAALAAGYFTPNAFILAAFLSVAAARERSDSRLEELRMLWRKREELRRHGVLAVRELVALGATPLREMVRHLAPGRFHLIWVVDEALEVLGVVEEPQLLEALSQRDTATTLREILPHL